MTSPDVDGLLSAAIVSSQTGAHVVGFYTTTWLVLFDGATPEDAANSLWLDHDISEQGVRCIGQHLVMKEPTDRLFRRHPISFNPNVHYRQSYRDSFQGSSGRKRDKYPFSTANLLFAVFGMSVPTAGTLQMALLAHADGSWSTPIDYPNNCRIWAELMFPRDEIIQFLNSGYTTDQRTLAAHRRLIAQLVELGIAARSSRIKNLDRLPAPWQGLTGHQGISGLINADPDSVPTRTRVQRFLALYDYVCEAFEVVPRRGARATSTVKGNVETPYPNSVTPDLDTFMADHAIFSHAFTNQRTMRFTNGIALRG